MGEGEWERGEWSFCHALVVAIMCVIFSLHCRVQLTVMFADGVTRLEKMKKIDHLRVCVLCSSSSRGEPP